MQCSLPQAPGFFRRPGLPAAPRRGASKLAPPLPIWQHASRHDRCRRLLLPAGRVRAPGQERPAAARGAVRDAVDLPAAGHRPEGRHRAVEAAARRTGAAGAGLRGAGLRDPLRAVPAGPRAAPVGRGCGGAGGALRFGQRGHLRGGAGRAGAREHPPRKPCRAVGGGDGGAGPGGRHPAGALGAARRRHAHPLGRVDARRAFRPSTPSRACWRCSCWSWGWWPAAG